MRTRCKHLGRFALVTCLVLQVALALLFLVRGWNRVAAGMVPTEEGRSPAVQIADEADAAELADWNILPPDDPVTAAQVAAAIRAAGDYLVAQCTESGQFIYRSNLDSAVVPRPRYNVIRHAGSIYSLAQYHRWHPSDDTLAALMRSAKFLKQHCIAPVDHSPELLAVWSRPELTHGRHSVKAKLGGAGLALVALTSLEQIQPGATSLETLRGLAHFILYTQKHDGSFYSLYIPSDGGLRDDWVSLYYPGEAALGLLMLYELDPDPRWLRAAAGTIAYLARTRRGKPTVAADHWALLATAKILPRIEQCESLLSREQALTHAEQVCSQILGEQQLGRSVGKAYGGFSSDGRTCPAATRLEGLLAILATRAADDFPLTSSMETAAAKGISFLLRAQVQEGPHAGAVPRGIARLPRLHGDYDRHFNERATEVRIDYVQHFLSAMIQYHSLVRVRDSRPTAVIDRREPAAIQGAPGFPT